MSVGSLTRPVVPLTTLCAMAEGNASVTAVSVRGGTSAQIVRNALAAQTPARPNCKYSQPNQSQAFDHKQMKNERLNEFDHQLMLRLDTLAINVVFRNCIECLGFESGPFKKNCTVACSSILHYQMVDRLTLSSKECKQKDSEGCWIKFKLDQLVGKDNYTAEIQKQKGKL